ncbi:allantoicase [Actinomycetospora sp. OC33-EN08]|uniref:Probable allantoicase n=1 Tax=Actinomycetospora aurantiaca TaxID=3129233 RepID=A0ABU8MIL9_9PSEU
MTRVVLAPDKFKGSLDAPGVADALAAGIAEVAPHWDVRRAPVADGGEGTVDAVLAAGWEPVRVPTTGPLGDPLEVTYARRGSSAVTELATTAGLGVLPGGALAPLDAGTTGLGTVLAHALEAGATHLVVGLGGSASTDGGAGLLVGLGARVLDADGRPVAPGGRGLEHAASLDLSGLHPLVSRARVTLACDVDNPLLGPHGAAAIYGPQKGADPADVEFLDAALARWAEVLRQVTGRDVAGVPGAGAAGGTAAAALAVLDAEQASGVRTVLELIGFDAVVAGADLVVTGEGRLDGQSLHGKAPTGVAEAARAAGAAVVAVAGDSDLDPEELRGAGFSGVHTLVALAPDRATAIADPAPLLRRIGRTLASTPSRREDLMDGTTPDLPDLASRALGGSVVVANDELFAERENLIRPEAPRFDPTEFGHKGKVYDGWETRRRREPGHDWAIVRLGAAGVLDHVVVDTAFFKGNYPPEISVEAASVEGYPADLTQATWYPVVERSAAQGDTANVYKVDDDRRFTHVRLSIFPDGGVARLRVHGTVVADPRFLAGTIDLLAAEHGGRLVECSDAFYASPANLTLPGLARHMGEGWENARRRGGGNDYAVFALAAGGVPRHVEVDTTWFVGNAPGWVSVSVRDSRAGTDWTTLLDRVEVRPDTRHRFLLPDAPAADHLRLDVFPDGGLSRLRLWGDLDADATRAARQRWWALLPEDHRALVADQAPV